MAYNPVADCPEDAGPVSAYPWLTETPWPTRQLPRDEQRQRIEHLLATHWMGVLCTTGRNGPIGSPVEYHAAGVVVFIRWQASASQLGKPLDQPPRVQMLRLEPERIVYTEQWLRKDGFGPRQIWHRDPDKEGAARALRPLGRAGASPEDSAE
jgi:hypothetical protein